MDFSSTNHCIWEACPDRALLCPFQLAGPWERITSKRCKQYKVLHMLWSPVGGTGVFLVRISFVGRSVLQQWSFYSHRRRGSRFMQMRTSGEKRLQSWWRIVTGWSGRNIVLCLSSSWRKPRPRKYGRNALNSVQKGEHRTCQRQMTGCMFALLLGEPFNTV
jgi:hypothetical protein